MPCNLMHSVEEYLKTTDDFGRAEELLLAAWLRAQDDFMPEITYDHCQSRNAVSFTVDKEKGFINGIYWGYDDYNEEHGDLTAIVLGLEFTHQAFNAVYQDEWFNQRWMGPAGDEVGDELNEALNTYVHSGCCDEWIFDEEPFVNRFIVESALNNAERREYRRIDHYLRDAEGRVYLARKRVWNEEEQEFRYISAYDDSIGSWDPWWLAEGLYEINSEEFIKLLLSQDLLISDEFEDDRIWSHELKKLKPMTSAKIDSI